jgi:hypothetical protein
VSLSLLFKQGESPSAAAPGSGPVTSSADGDKVRVVMDVGAGRRESTYVLEDREGADLVLVTYTRAGGVKIQCGSGLPFLAGGPAGANRAYEVEARHGRYLYRLGIRGNGSSDVSASGPADVVLGCLGITPAGEFVHDRGRGQEP